jgi:hypothetical protein
VFGVFGSDISDAEVVDHQTKRNGACFVIEEAWGEFDLVVPVAVEMFDQFVIGKAAGLWEAVHALAYLHVDETIMGDCGHIVVVNYSLGEQRNGDAHVLESGHSGIQVEIFDVNRHPFGAGGGYGAVEEVFDRV